MLLHQKVSRLMHRALLVSVLVSALVFMVHSFFYTEKALHKEGEYLARIVFDRLYSSMMSGWDKHSIDQIFVDLNSLSPDIELHLHRAAAVEKQFGLRETQPLSAAQQAFLVEGTAPTALEYRYGEGVTFSQRLLFKPECLGCHTQAQEGQAAGVLELTYPLSSVRVSLWGTLVMAFLIIGFTLFFCFWLFSRFVANHIEAAIEKLVARINSIASHDDLDARIDIDTDIVEIRQIEEAFNQKNARLKSAYESLETVSVTDRLTGLYNRNKLAEALGEEISRHRRYGTCFSLVMMDLDGFKQINDCYGHDAGDKALVVFADLIRNHLRPTDTAVRLGGDEFLVLLSHTDKEHAKRYIKSIRDEVDGHIVEHNGHRFALASSIGLASCQEDGAESELLLSVADQSMYSNKQARKQKKHRNHVNT